MLLVAFKPLELLVRILAHFRIVGFAGWESIRSYLYEPPPSSLLFFAPPSPHPRQIIRSFDIDCEPVVAERETP